MGCEEHLVPPRLRRVLIGASRVVDSVTTMGIDQYGWRHARRSDKVCLADRHVSRPLWKDEVRVHWIQRRRGNCNAFDIIFKGRLSAHTALQPVTTSTWQTRRTLHRLVAKEMRICCVREDDGCGETSCGAVYAALTCADAADPGSVHVRVRGSSTVLLV